MLRHPALHDHQPQTWADFGSGKGVFTHALASLLPDASNIFAIDTDADALEKIPAGNGVSISIIVADFTKPVALPKLNGILMANSIHYVQHKEKFLQHLKTYLQPDAYLLMVEYDMNIPNPWVPYPLGFSAMQQLLTHNGFSAPEKINERRSIYNKGIMYSCISKLVQP